MIDGAVSHLKNGDIISFPTETYYGLGVDPFNKDAIENLFTLKKREKSKAILLLIDDINSITEVVASVPDIYIPLMSKFWPGPLTLLFPTDSRINPLLTGGSHNIGVRISSHPIAQHLLKVWKRPLTATSANISGNPPANNTSEVNHYFGTSITCVIDGGPSISKKPSTIVGVGNKGIKVIREGRISLKELTEVLYS